jgi:predicted small secreted protein
MIRRARFLTTALVATAIVAAATATVAGAGSDSPSPKQWANGVCSGIETWISSVEDTITSLEGSASIEEAAQSTSDGIRDATDELASDLDDLGTPKTKNVKQATDALDKLESQLQDDMENIQDALSDPGTEPVDIAATFATIGTELQKAVDHVRAAGDSLRKLGANNKEIQKAFESASACTSLKEAL